MNRKPALLSETPLFRMDWLASDKAYEFAKYKTDKPLVVTIRDDHVGLPEAQLRKIYECYSLRRVKVTRVSPNNIPTQWKDWPNAD